MRKVVVGMFMSLDGVVENPMWSLTYWGDDIANFKQRELFDADALLLGRDTYQGFAQAWPGREDEEGYADHINSMAKYVASTTMESGDWGPTTIYKQNLAAEVAKLKAQAGKDILIFGSVSVIEALIPHNLIDVYNILVYPIVLGKGAKLFRDGTETTLTLAENKTFQSGAVGLVYHTAPSASE